MNDDIVEDNILTRSDVRDLLRCKSVCKSWYSMISSPNFIKAHLKHHKSNTRINNIDVGRTRIAMPTFWKIPNEEDDNLYQRNEWRLVGSSNGLVCVSLLLAQYEEGEDLILLINPRTREVRELPIPTIPPKQDIYHNISLSFGYDSSTDDYKLLMGINRMGVDGSLVQVFSLRSMTWTLIGHINYLIIYGFPGVLLDGAFHWFAHDYSIKKQVILSFDLSREEFKAFPKPVDSRYVVPFSTLGIFQDNLCLSCVDENDIYYGIWVLRNYNSWEFLSNNYEIKSPDAVYFMNIYACTSPTRKRRMGFFCHDRACFSKPLKRIISDPIYVQSLVSPYLNTEIPSHAGSVKVAERECEEMRMFERATKDKCYKGYEERLREIMEIYKLEGGENEKFYWREYMNKKNSRDVKMSKGKSIMGILAKEEVESSKRKREE